MRRLSLFSMFAATVAALLIGCGGKGGSGGGTGGGGSKLSVSYDLKGVSGTIVNSVVASASPQTVQVDTGGSVQTVSNVIVGTAASSGQFVTILSEGSQVLNVTLSNAGSGATIGGTSIHVPISSSGVLQASVLGANTTPDQAVIATPPGTWNGVPLPNGVNVLLESSNPGQLEVAVSGQVAQSNNKEDTGNLTVTYTAPSVSQTQAIFSGGSGNINVNGQSISGGAGTYSATWNSFDKSTTFTTANIGAAF